MVRYACRLTVGLNEKDLFSPGVRQPLLDMCRNLAVAVHEVTPPGEQHVCLMLVLTLLVELPPGRHSSPTRLHSQVQP